MARYHLLTKPSYLADRRRLPREIRLKVMKCEELLDENIRHPGRQTKRVQGQKDLFEARVDLSYRLLYSHEGNVIRLLAVGPHDVLERRFRVESMPEDLWAVVSRQSGLAPSIRSSEVTKERSGSLVATPELRKLAKQIDGHVLASLAIPVEWHAALAACRTEQDLLASTVPDPYLLRLIEYLYPKPIDSVLDEPNLEVPGINSLSRHSEQDRPAMAFARQPSQPNPGASVALPASRGFRPQQRARRVIPRWTLAGDTPKDRALELYEWLISEVDAGRAPLCTYKAGVDMVLLLKKFTPAYLGQLLRLATKCGERPIEGLGTVRLDTFLVNQTYRPGDGHWPSVNYSAGTWDSVFDESPAIE